MFRRAGKSDDGQGILRKTHKNGYIFQCNAQKTAQLKDGVVLKELWTRLIADCDLACFRSNESSFITHMQKEVLNFKLG
jgi:hypothetical protein